jgi:hypothetical protein
MGRKMYKKFWVTKNLFFELSKDITLTRTDKTHQAASKNII